MTAPTPAGSLARVRRAAAKATTARRQLEDEIERAHQAGEPLRKIGPAAGLSHQRIAQLLNSRSAK